MKAKILLTGLVAPLMFAACTQEEAFVPQQEAGKIDLSNRPTLGKVTLGFDSQTRATLNDEGLFNSLLWEAGDAVGARIIDTPKTPIKSYVNPIFGYDIAKYASTNYKFEKGTGSVWESEALMIEGNYMFYAPYAETALYRDPLKMVFPIAQTINPESEQMEKANANTDAIKNFFEDETTTTVVGYKFLSAKSPEKVVSPTMTHIYAYPQITLKNNYTVDEDSNPSTPAVAKPITIDKIVLSSAKFRKNYQINQTGLFDVLREAYAKAEPVKVNNVTIEEGNDEKYKDAGAWKNATKMLQDGRTSTITTSSDDDETDITVTFDPALTIAAEGDFKFHVVLPAEAYEDLKATVYLAGSKSFVTGTTAVQFAPAANLTYAPGKRYAKEEYNFEDGKYEIKDGTAGELATFTLEGTIGDYVAPVFIQNADDFEEYLVALNNNTKEITEWDAVTNEGDFKLQQKGGFAEMTIDESIVALRNKYLSAGKIHFKSNMKVKGNITLNSDYSFAGTLTQESGNLTLKSKVAGDATFNGTVILDNAALSKKATFKAAATITDATINGAIEFNGGNSSVKTLKGSAATAAITAGSVTIREDATVIETLKWAVNAGELVVNKAGFASEKNPVTIGTWNTTDDKVNTSGKLTVNKAYIANWTTLTAGEIINNGDNFRAGTTFSSNWKTGKVTNKGTHVVPGIFTVAKDNDYVNEGTVNLEGSSTFVNKGNINNNSTIVIASNEGKIVVAEGSSTYVEDGSATGEIDNTKGGALFLTGCDNTVSYTFTELQTTEDIENFDAKLYGVNKVIFNAGINFNKKFEDMTKVFYGVNIIDINGGTNGATITIAPNVAMPANAKVMNITGKVTIDGFKKDVSQLAITNKAGDGTKINVAKNAVLKIKEVSMGAGLTTGKLIFNLATPTAEELEDGVKAGKIELENANLYVGTTGDVPAVTKDAYSATGKMYWDFATPTASWKN